nr:hypothetical protein [Tanacetum cinerariifolium]
MMLESVKHDPLIWPTVEENGKYDELSATKKIQADCDMKATNIILQGLPLDIYSLVNHHRVAKDLWERIQLLMQESRCNKFRGDNVKVILVLGKGHLARQCNQPKRPRNVAWYKDKAMLAEAQEAGQILDEQQFTFLTDLGVPDGQVVQIIIPNNAAFQTKDLGTYDSDCDDISNAKAVLMANISNYGSDVISEENINKEQNNKSVTAELERYKERVNTFEQHLNIDLSSHEKMIDSQMDDMIKEKIALKEQVDSLEQNLSKQIKEKECLLQTFTVFKNKSKEKEDKYMENEIDLEKR